MKNIIWLIFTILICGKTYAETTYYYNRDNKVELGYRTNKLLITFQKNISDEQRASVLQEISKYNTSVFENGNTNGNIEIPMWAVISLNSANEQLVKEKLLSMPEVAYASIMYTNNAENNSNQLLGIPNEIIVELNVGFSKEDLIREALKYNCAIKAQSKAHQSIYILSCKKQNDVLAISNEMHISGFFKYAQPNFLHSNVLAGDPLYYKQWYMYNPTDRAVDNNIDDAHAVTMGRPEIKIAIMDTGVEYEHEDLDGQFIVPGYSPSGYISVGKPAGWFLSDHGTKVAGIAGAIADNNIGIKGVAPKCKFISILVNAGVSGWSFDQEIVDGIYWAADHGVDVINMSLYIISPASAYNVAVDYAASTGRNNRGCIMVVAAGNSQGLGPLNGLCIDKVIAVGASDKLKQRAPYSNYDMNTISVVAPVGYSLKDNNGNFTHPDDLCYTTYPDPYSSSIKYTEGPGTSFAAPQVAGLAGLILSVNPCLNYTDVKKVIENTADKMSPNLYRYCTDWTNHPNGTWNQEVGYGKINCGRAVRRAIDMMGTDGVPINTSVVSTSQTLLLSLPTPIAGTNCNAIPTGTYSVTRKAVTHIYDRSNWPVFSYHVSSNGISPDVSPLTNNGANYVSISYPAWNQIAFTTYVYEITSGTYAGHYPVDPSQVKFFIGRDKYNPFYLQNITVNGLDHKFKNVEPIEAGYNVTTLISNGNYILNAENKVEFISKKVVKLMPGFSVDAHLNNYFEARIAHYNPNCDDFPEGLEKTTTSSEGYNQVSEQNFFSEKTASKLSIHPNPTTGQLNITMPAPGDYEVKISNMLGVVVYQGKLKDEQQKQIQLENSLPSGNYTVQITGKDINHIEKITLTR